MSITIKLLTNKSNKNELIKSTEEIIVLNGIFKEETSIINPILIIETGADNIKNVNYIHILEFNRYYFVNEITTIRNNLWELNCHVDVLSSFADEIKENEAIINRQENNWNLFLNDNSMRCYQNPYVVTREFPSGFSTNLDGYVMIVAGSPNDDVEPS